jgi:hypothetical protein
VYAALAATLLSQAVGAQVKGRLAEQLQTAFDHRSRIERAKTRFVTDRPGKAVVACC